GREPERALPARRRDDRKLDGADLARRPAARGPPREIDLAAPDPHGAPVRRELEGVRLIAPDVVAARIDELELERVCGRHAADVEGERILIRQREREALAGDD